VAIGLLWYGAVLVLQPKITVGILISFFLYVALASAGATSLSAIYTQYKQCIGALSRVLELSNCLNYFEVEGQDITSITGRAARQSSRSFRLLFSYRRLPSPAVMATRVRRPRTEKEVGVLTIQNLHFECDASLHCSLGSRGTDMRPKQ
jgi:ABC-type multidrug transport system fused ATPase/permease subunit